MPLPLCYKCNEKLAVWHYMPMTTRKDIYFCDDCVPRGCSCNIPINSSEEERDEQGRLLPCCEYWYDDRGIFLE